MLKTLISNMKNTVCLCAIVKNEEKIILDMLKSCVKWIDYAIICDTGSEDNTIEIMEKFFTENEILHHIYKIKWENFPRNRNHYIHLAQNLTSHILVLDADEILIVKNENWKDKLEDFHLIKIRENEGCEIKYPNIFRNDNRIKYVGEIHEQPIFPSDFKEGISLDSDIMIIHTSKGENRKNKWKRDLIICIERDPFPKIPENAGRREYYMAICALNLEDFQMASDYFVKRFQMDTPENEEEKWHAYMMYGFCKVVRAEIHEFPQILLYAYLMRPWRLEPLDLLLKACEMYGMRERENNVNMIFKSAQKHAKYPKNDRIAIYPELYPDE